MTKARQAAGNKIGTNVAILVTGGINSEKNAFLVREYIMDRSNRNNAMNMLS